MNHFIHILVDKPWWHRLLLAVPVLLMWFLFSVGTVFVLMFQFIGTLIYVARGNDSIRAWVTKTGQGTDALNNAAWFGGDQRETISSHTGRWYQFVVDHPTEHITIPLCFRVVRWLTDKFEPGHVIKAIELPFVGRPL